MFDAHHLIAEHGIDEARRLALDKHERVCIDAAAAIMALQGQPQESAYASMMTTCLPHRQPTDGFVQTTCWKRQVGLENYCVESGQFDDGSIAGVPFGAKARMALIDLHTEAIRQGSPVIAVASTRHAFLKRLGLGGGGMTYKQTINQARRIATCHITIRDEADSVWASRLVDSLVYESGTISPNTRDLDANGASKSVVLTRAFYDRIVAQQVRLSLPALRLISDNSWAIDLYIWLACELPRLTAPMELDWKSFALGSGMNYRRARQLRGTFLHTLQLVRAIYPQAKVDVNENGFQIYPSPPPD